MAVDEDAVVRVIGQVGRWQVHQSMLLSLVGVLFSWQVVGIVFLAPATEHWCAPADQPGAHQQRSPAQLPLEMRDGAMVRSQCRAYDWHTETGFYRTNATVACNRWQYDTSEYTSNIIIEWNLVCGRSWLHIVAKSSYMAGIMLGVIAWGMIADRFGRRPALLACLALNCVCCTITAASTSVEMFLVLRFMSAFFGVGMYTTGFVMSMELAGDRWRALLGITYCLPVSFGFMAVGGLAFLVRGWRWFQLATALPGLAFVAFYWLVPESPRWLLSKGRVSEARPILESICKYNACSPLEKFPEREYVPMANQPTESFFELLRNAKTTIMLACLFVCWFVNSMVFYGILLQTDHFGGNIYLNTTLGGVVEVPALVICAYAIYRLGRRAPISLNMVGAGMAGLLTFACKSGGHAQDWPVACLALIGRFCITASFSTIYVYTAELFPTSVRNTCLACCSVGSRLGGILAPFVAMLRDAVHPAVPALLFGGSAVASGLSILLLPETANAPLPGVIADMGAAARRQSVRSDDSLPTEPVVV